MKNEVCHCMASEARKIGRLNVAGVEIGINRLDETIEEVHLMDLWNGNEIAETLLKKIKVFNYVPSEASEEYSKALLEEYLRRYEE